MLQDSEFENHLIWGRGTQMHGVKELRFCHVIERYLKTSRSEVWGREKEEVRKWIVRVTETTNGRDRIRTRSLGFLQKGERYLIVCFYWRILPTPYSLAPVNQCSTNNR